MHRVHESEQCSGPESLLASDEDFGEENEEIQEPEEVVATEEI